MFDQFPVTLEPPRSHHFIPHKFKHHTCRHLYLLNISLYTHTYITHVKALGCSMASMAMAMPIFHLDHAKVLYRVYAVLKLLCIYSLCEVILNLMIIIVHGRVPWDNALSKFW